jgi:FOG: PKD repeat
LDTLTEIVTITNNSTGSNIIYLWDFGDGNTSTLAFPNHTYITEGSFNLCLTVTDVNGCSSMQCDSIDADYLVNAGVTINVVDGSTEIEELKLIYDIQVYPNPAKDIVILELNLKQQIKTDIFVTDLLGNRIKAIASKKLNSGENKLLWETEDSPSGIYFINVRMNNSLQVKKVVLNR